MTGRHRSRPTRPTGVRPVKGWSLKRYEITLDGEPIEAATLDAAEAVLTAALPDAPVDDGVGFVIVHHGAEQVWLLVDRWEGDILSQLTFFADLDDPTAFEPVGPGGPTACVWELAVHAHERDAYIRHVLDPSDGPDVEAYLGDTLTIDGR